MTRTPRRGEWWLVRPQHGPKTVTARVSWVSHDSAVIEGLTATGEFVRRGLYAWLRETAEPQAKLPRPRSRA